MMTMNKKTCKMDDGACEVADGRMDGDLWHAAEQTDGYINVEVRGQTNYQPCGGRDYYYATDSHLIQKLSSLQPQTRAGPRSCVALCRSSALIVPKVTLV